MCFVLLRFLVFCVLCVVLFSFVLIVVSLAWFWFTRCSSCVKVCLHLCCFSFDCVPRSPNDSSVDSPPIASHLNPTTQLLHTRLCSTYPRIHTHEHTDSLTRSFAHSLTHSLTRRLSRRYHNTKHKQNTQTNTYSTNRRTNAKPIHNAPSPTNDTSSLQHSQKTKQGVLHKVFPKLRHRYHNYQQEPSLYESVCVCSWKLCDTKLGDCKSVFSCC